MSEDTYEYCPICETEVLLKNAEFRKPIKCPNCGNNIRVGLTNFKSVSFKYGLVWTCPNCFADFHIKKIELEGNKE